MDDWESNLSKRPTGRCLLTGTEGPMAKSHIIPNSFLQRSTHAPFMEFGDFGKPKRNYQGWYDQTILTDAGEQYFVRADDAAAKCFHGGGFTYKVRRDPSDLNRIRGGFVAHQIYAADDVDVSMLRLFALSMLWRAAVSSLDAFSSVWVSPSHLSDLKSRILSGQAGPPTEYPVYFGVFCDGTELTKVTPWRMKNHPFYRFFLDGVVCYVSPTRRNGWAEKLGALLAGSANSSIYLQCFSSLDSIHERHTSEEARNIHRRYGEIFAGFKKDAARRR